MDAPIDVVAIVASATEFGSTSTNLDWPLRAGVECHRLVGFVGIGPCAISPLIKAYMEAAQFFKCQKCRGTWKTTTWTITTRSEIKNSFSFFLYIFFFNSFFVLVFKICQWEQPANWIDYSISPLVTVALATAHWVILIELKTVANDCDLSKQIERHLTAPLHWFPFSF